MWEPVSSISPPCAHPPCSLVSWKGPETRSLAACPFLSPPGRHATPGVFCQAVTGLQRAQALRASALCLAPRPCILTSGSHLPSARRGLSVALPPKAAAAHRGPAEPNRDLLL